MNNRQYITVSKNEIMNPTCNVCISDNDVKEILFHGVNYGTGVVLCKECRMKLIKALVAATDFDSVSDLVSVLT